MGAYRARTGFPLARSALRCVVLAAPQHLSAPVQVTTVFPNDFYSTQQSSAVRHLS